MATITRPVSSPPNRMNGAPAQPPVRPKLGRINLTSLSTAPRIVLNAVEGWGKTTFGAYAPNPAVLMSRGESGYATLRSKGLVPDADCVELTRWADVLGQLDELGTGANKYGAIVLDALGGFERLCHEHVCARDFGGDWGEKGFSSFQKGPDVSVAEWIGLLNRLDKVRQALNCPIVFLSHSTIKPFKNPMGPDFDRYIADCHAKTWGVTHKWADAVFFGTYLTVAVEDKKTRRTKGVGGDERVLYTTRRDAYDAKNRYAMPPQLDIPPDASAMWSTVWDAINAKAEVPPADEIPE
jgi:hypothetical protein